MKPSDVLFLLCIFPLFPQVVMAATAQSETQADCIEQVGSLVSIQGRAERNKAGTNTWQVIATNNVVCRGDTIRMLDHSRAALLLDNNTVIRLDQGTTVTLIPSENDKPFLIRLIKGILYYFSIKPRSLELDTPFVNGAVEGTEFIAVVGDQQTQISVLEGHVLTQNTMGSVMLYSGQQSTTKKDQPPTSAPVVNSRKLLQWTVYYPPLIDLQQYLVEADRQNDNQKVISEAVQCFFNNDLRGGINLLDTLADQNNSPDYYKVRASVLLAAGRVDQARATIETMRNLHNNDSTVPAFLAVISLLNGEVEAARELAQQSIDMEPDGSAALVAMSYVQQASFQLDQASASIASALQSHPNDGLLLSRSAELIQSMDNTNTRAIEAAETAAQNAPNLAYPHMVLGFALLNRLEVDRAANEFELAIQLDQASPLPRLGLGLVEIYKGNLARGRNLLSIAVALDPGISLLRSYLGKAYYEEGDFARAGKQLQIAKELDPKDPTPYFYSAILSTRENKPGEALHDLKKSISLNDNRAIFRSRLMLDSDLAARSADTARVFNQLGFSDLARNYGTESLTIAPADYSSHRLLADSYATMPRHELASVSELLQSQLLQPQNIRPIQPQLAEAHMQILDGSGPSLLSNDEYSPLFHRNTINLLADGVVGGEQTFGDDLVAFGVYDKFSFSLGQYYYTTDGVRENNDLAQQLYNAFAQYRLTLSTNIIFEYRDNEKEFGDRTILFDSSVYDDAIRQQNNITSWRFGGHHELKPGSDIITTIVAQEVDTDMNGNYDYGSIAYQRDIDSVGGEIQHIYSSSFFRSVIGASYSDSELLEEYSIDGFLLADPESFDTYYTSYYGYGYLPLFSSITLTTGLNYSRIDNGEIHVQAHKGSPKMGLVWQPTPDTSIHLAWLKGISRTFISDQTIEPTQVAGINQFYIDPLGTESELYGFGLNHEISSQLFSGVSYVYRNLKVPYKYNHFDGTIENYRADWKEHLAKLYLNWLPQTTISVSTEYLYEKFDRGEDFFGEDFFEQLETHKGKMQLAWFDQSGFRAKCSATFVHQQGTFVDRDSYPYILETQEDSDSFWLIDGSIGYQLPKTYGLINLQIKNLFNADFRFQEFDPDKLEVARGRLLILQFSKSF